METMDKLTHSAFAIKRLLVLGSDSHGILPWAFRAHFSLSTSVGVIEDGSGLRYAVCMSIILFDSVWPSVCQRRESTKHNTRRYKIQHKELREYTHFSSTNYKNGANE